MTFQSNKSLKQEPAHLCLLGDEKHDSLSVLAFTEGFVYHRLQAAVLIFGWNVPPAPLK